MAGKTTARLIFGGENIRTDAPNRRQRLRENKRKTTRKRFARRSPKVGWKTRRGI